MSYGGVCVSKIHSDIVDGKAVYDDNEEWVFVGHTLYHRDDIKAVDLFYNMLQWVKNGTLHHDTISKESTSK